jgi:hypothetical protein
VLSLPDDRPSMAVIPALADPYERSLWAALSILGRPDGVLDFGCMSGGILVRVLKDLNLRPVKGVTHDRNSLTQLPLPLHSWVYERALYRPFALPQTYDLVLALGLDVLTPVPSVPTLLDNITRHCSRWLIVTGPQWERDIARRGFEYRPEETGLIDASWSRIWGMGTDVLVMRRP